MTVLDFPTGSIAPMSGVFSPDGWATCNGAALDGTKDANLALWLVIGTTYGGTGQASFLLPNLGGRVLMGSSTPASWQGSKSITLDSSTSGLAAHNHTITDPLHTHPMTGAAHSHTYQTTSATAGSNPTKFNFTFAIGGGSLDNVGDPPDLTGVATGMSLTSNSLTAFTAAATSINSASAHQNMQPYMAFNFMIKL